MKLIKKNLTGVLSLLTLTTLMFSVFILPAISLADSGGPIVNPPPCGGKILNPLDPHCPSTKGVPSITAFIHDALIGALKIGIPVVALAIIYSGFLFVFAMGNPEKLKKAKDALLYTLIGAAILLGAWAIANLIVDTVANIT